VAAGLGRLLSLLPAAGNERAEECKLSETGVASGFLRTGTGRNARSDKRNGKRRRKRSGCTFRSWGRNRKEKGV
jgi:hypothetical protein